jgi:hypothetical protein
MRKLILLPLAALLSTATMAVTPVAPKQFRPKDECMHLDGYFAFRQSFEDIVKKRNSAGLQALIAPNIVWNLGGEPDTKSAFSANWKLAKGAASPIWQEFDKILPLGCGTQEKGIAFPYIFTVDIGDVSGTFEEVLITGEDVNLRASGSTNAASKGKLSWEIVKVKDGIVVGGWTPVTTADGKTGFIKSNYLRSPIDYRAGFEKQGGKWVMNFFIAGD